MDDEKDQQAKKDTHRLYKIDAPTTYSYIMFRVVEHDERYMQHARSIPKQMPN